MRSNQHSVESATAGPMRGDEPRREVLLGALDWLLSLPDDESTAKGCNGATGARDRPLCGKSVGKRRRRIDRL